MKSKLKEMAKGKVESPSNAPPPVTRAPIATGDPQLSSYILNKALKRPEGVSFTDLARALLDAKDRANDKAFRAQLPALLLRLSFYEDLPSGVVTRLVPLFSAYSKDPKVLRSLFYLCGVHVSRGSAGTPTLIDSVHQAGIRPDVATLQAVLAEGDRMLQAPDTDPAVRRAAAYLLAAAGRGTDAARKDVLAALERCVATADAMAAAGGNLPATGKKGGTSGTAAVLVTSSNDWELQHTVFAGVRLSDASAGSTDLGPAAFQGVGSPDPVGARHAVALVAELAFRDPALVLQELAAPLADAAELYEAAGPATVRAPGAGINLEDAFARLHLARACAAVLHSDHSAADPSRGGGPFWRMLCLLATRDPSDLVRFGALEAMTGAAVGPTAAALAKQAQRPSDRAATREAAVMQQRRARAWRLLATQAGALVVVPGVTPPAESDGGGGMKLIEVIGRLLVLALTKVESAARFCVAASVASSLAESCMASQSVGSSRHVTSPDVDRIISILARELGSLIESPLRPAQRCGCVEALLYLQAAGYSTTLTPAKVAGIGGRGGGGSVQSVLLTAVLKCARARPKDAAVFLGYASGVVGISPSSIDLLKVAELWDGAAAAGKDGKVAALSAALDSLRSPPPPCTRPLAAGGAGEVVRAAREDAGWNGFVATAVWWLGEHANEVCEEFAGRQVSPPPAPKDGKNHAGNASDDQADAASSEGSGSGSDYSAEDDAGGDEGRASPSSVAAQHEAVLARQANRNPALSRVIASLHDTVLTSTWQLRAAAARALAKIAVRSGEPYRLHCYGILTACAVSGGKGQDALGLQGVIAPALGVLDKMYATQAVLETLWARHGDDPEAWPDEIIASLARRASAIRDSVERTIAAVPKERYALLGPKAVAVLAHATEEGPAYASFLSSATAGGGDKKKDRASDAQKGASLTVSKNKEVEDILSFGSDVSIAKAFPEAAAGGGGGGFISDKDREIESLLSGGASGPESGAADAWAFTVPTAAAAEPNRNAFADEAPGSSLFTIDTTTRTATGGAEAFPPASPGTVSSTPRSLSQRQPTLERQLSDAAGTARVIGSGAMLHTFIADSTHPEELSIFEGDRVEVLEESDGWLLVRDPTGSQGLVPTAYVQIERLMGGSGIGVGGGLARAPSSVGSPRPLASPPSMRAGGGHSRMVSMDMGGTTNEDFLDRFFSSSTAQPSTTAAAAVTAARPGMQEGQPWADFGTTATLAASSSPSFPRSGSGSPRKSGRAVSPSRLSPGGAGGAGNPFVGGVLSGGGGSVHRRMASQASSHQRTLSGGSDPWGSMPGTPGNPVEGPERVVAAAFTAEMEGELSVEAGDRVKVHSEVGGWARVMRVSDAKVGLVPSWAVAV